MIKDVLTIGDERLLQKSLEMNASEFNTKPLDDLITDMRDTMHAKGGVGISAVQIGLHKRIAIIEYNNENSRYKNIGSYPLTVIINPVIEAVGSETYEYNEGCLSVPGQRGDVNRPKHVRYTFYDQFGKQISGESDSFFARVLQHEVDHMDGILFPMRIKDVKND